MRVPRLTPWLVVVTLAAAGAAAAAGYGLTAPKRYAATAELLVAPIPASDSTFAGLDLLRDTSGRRTAAENASVLLHSPQVADSVRAQLGLRLSRDALLAELDTHVVDSSNVVDVTVRDMSAAASAQLANAFVDALIATRTTTFQSQLAGMIRQDAQLLRTGGSGRQATELARRLAVLRGLQGQPDPTLRRATTATAPARASGPDLAVLIGIGAGCGLGAAALVLLAQALWRRRDRETGLLPTYSPGAMSDGALEAFVDRLEKRLAARESALAARERDLQARIAELKALEARRRPAAAAEDGRAAELEQREQELEERIAAVTKRELAVARAAAQAHVVPTAAPAPAPAPATAAAPPPRTAGGAYNLAALERLVAAHAVAHPERRDEWESYLFFLRDYAATDGALPPRFDGLVEETFRELL